jgi:hypothetical protein
MGENKDVLRIGRFGDLMEEPKSIDILWLAKPKNSGKVIDLKGFLIVETLTYCSLD